MERDAAGDRGEQFLDGGPARLRVQAADDRYQQPGHRPPRFPKRRSKRSTRPAVSSTRALPV